MTKQELIDAYVALALSHMMTGDHAEDALKKIHKATGGYFSLLDTAHLKWCFCEPGLASLNYLGETTEYNIPPTILLEGTCGANLFYKKFVSHPFYQQGRT